MDLQDEEYQRTLLTRAAEETLFGRALLENGIGKVCIWLNCIDGSIRVTIDANVNSIERR